MFCYLPHPPSDADLIASIFERSHVWSSLVPGSALPGLNCEERTAMENRDRLERTRGTFGESQEARSEEPTDDDGRESQQDEPSPPSPATQIGRAKQTGGTPDSGLEAGAESREGWPMPDQSDTPEEWPQPTID